MPGSDTPSRRPQILRFALRTAYVAFWVVAIGYLAVRLERLWHQRRVRQQAPAPTEEKLYANDPQHVIDDVVGWRPRGLYEVDYNVTSIDGKRFARCWRHTDRLGLVQRQELPSRLSRPCVLLVGDSHLFGIVSNEDNASALIQAGLRRFPGGEETTVINASSGYYCPYQYLLRVRQLQDRVRPQLVIAVIYLGNDLIELEDLGRPHLDDDGHEQPAEPTPPPETTSARIAWLQQLPPGLFWQGLNQSAYLLQRPDRLVAIERKLRVTGALLHQFARAKRFAVLVVLLPSYEMAYPQRLQSLSENARAAIDHTRSLGLPARVRAILEQEGIESLDLTPAFARSADPDLYANDYHIWRQGHALLAAEVTPVAARALDLKAARNP